MKPAKSELIDWFGNPIIIPENPCVGLFGPDPGKRQCNDCVHLISLAGARTYWKCRKRKVTRGPGSDHKRAWPACAKFEQRIQDHVQVYDGR